MLKDILKKLLTISAAATFIVGFSGTGSWGDPCKKECSHHKGEDHKHCMHKCESKTGGEDSKDRGAKTPHDGHHTPHGYHHKHSDEAKS